MAESGVDDAIHVLVVSDDPGFRRLAAHALGREGHVIRTALGPARLPRLLLGQTTEVVVVDGDHAAREVRAVITSLDLIIAIVHVKAPGALGVTKWGPLAALVAEVQIAAEQARDQRRGPHLRIVS